MSRNDRLRAGAGLRETWAGTLRHPDGDFNSDPVWECSHHHETEEAAVECATAQLNSMTIDPDVLWQRIMDLARLVASEQPDRTTYTGLLAAVTAMHEHLTTNGRFPEVWTNDPRRRMDGPTEYIISGTPLRDGKRVIMWKRSGLVWAPVVAVAEEDSVDVLTAIRNEYELGRQEAREERT